ncbi:MAG: hypothetical protein ACK5X0_05840 [Rhodospirillales bacterium]|jgi:hypothetical protein
MTISSETMHFLREPLVEFGRRWATSTDRPRPDEAILAGWDTLLSKWSDDSGIPLFLRKSTLRGTSEKCANGREVRFADNSPASWSFALALDGLVPEIEDLRKNYLTKIPISILERSRYRLRDLNCEGWKVCHIDAVSCPKAKKIGTFPLEKIVGGFKRFLSPRNMFLIPKSFSGAGELKEVIDEIKKESGLITWNQAR